MARRWWTSRRDVRRVPARRLPGPVRVPARGGRLHGAAVRAANFTKGFYTERAARCLAVSAARLAKFGKVLPNCSIFDFHYSRERAQKSCCINTYVHFDWIPFLKIEFRIGEDPGRAFVCSESFIRFCQKIISSIPEAHFLLRCFEPFSIEHSVSRPRACAGMTYRRSVSQ